MISRISVKMTLMAVLVLALGRPVIASECDNDPQIDIYKKALKADKKNVDNLYNLSVAYYQKGCYQDAIDSFEKVLKTNTKDKAAHAQIDPDAFSILGILYYQEVKDDKKAVSYFKKALALKPSDKDNLLGIGLALSRQENFKEAVEYLRKAAVVDSENVNTHYRLAEALYFLVDKAQVNNEKPDSTLLKKTQDEFAKSAELGEADKKTYADILYVSYTRLGQLADETKDKIKWYKEVIEIDPTDMNAHFQLGLQYHKIKNYAEMVTHYEKAVEINPKHELALFNLAVAYINQGDTYKAYKRFSDITELTEFQDPGLKNEALVLQAQTFQKAIDDNMGKGVDSFTQEKYGDALENFRAVIDIDPKNKDAKRYEKESIEAIESGFKTYMGSARSLHEKGSHTEALEAVDGALLLKKEDDGAKNLRKKIMKEISGLVEVYLANGARFEKQKNYSAAEREYRKALRFRKGKQKAKIALASLKKKTAGAFQGLLDSAKKAEKSGDLLAAQSLFKQAKRENPESKEAVNGLTKVNNEIDSQIKKFNEAGKKLFANGKKSPAQDEFDKTLALDPDDKTANDYVQRITGSQSSAKLNKEKVKKLYYQGVDYYVNNKIQKAIDTWQQLLKLDPSHADARKNIERAQAKIKAIDRLKGNG